MRVFLGVVLLSASVVRAATFTAASCSRADVQSAVLQASAGDEVLIPAGRCAWSTQLTITTGLTLRGAGDGVTVLIDDVPKDGTDQSRLLVFENATGLRLTALTIEGRALDPGVWNFGHVAVSGATRGFRLDHLSFALETTGVRVEGESVGVIDHCTFSGDFKQGVVVSHDSWDGGSYGDSSWASPSSLGTVDQLFVEDCTFFNSATAAQGGVATLGGGRAVVRHNVFNDTGVYAYGTDSSGRNRATRHLEVSNNRFQTGLQFLEPAIIFNGGTGVVFGNQVEPGFGAAVGLEVLRANNSYTVWGRCNGSNPLDENSQANGYACLDSVGRGAGLLLSGDTPTPMSWPQQVLEPVFVWSNAYDAGAVISNDSPGVLAAGRDYLEQPRAGFVEYPYPHPLTVEPSSTPDGGPAPADGGQGRYWRVIGCACAQADGAVLLALLLWLPRRRRAATSCAALWG